MFQEMAADNLAAQERIAELTRQRDAFREALDKTTDDFREYRCVNEMAQQDLDPDVIKQLDANTSLLTKYPKENP